MGFWDWLTGSKTPESASERNIGNDVGEALKNSQDYYGKGGALDQANEALHEQNEREEQEHREAVAEAAAAAKNEDDRISSEAANDARSGRSGRE